MLRKSMFAAVFCAVAIASASASAAFAGEITGNGTLKAVVTLFGQYVATGFQIASDGTLGSVITYNPNSGPTGPVLAAKH